MSLSSAARRPNPASRWRVALLLTLFFGALEGFTRFKLIGMSRDLRRFKTYPQRAARLHDSPPLRIAWLGNSATERGVDLAVVRRSLKMQRIAATTDLFVADASHINTWKWMAAHLFWRPNQAPDVLIVPFFNCSLQDGNTIEIGRLAQFFTSPREIPGALAAMPDMAGKFDFAASKLCATYAERERLKERVMSLMVPNYRHFAEALQAATPPQTGTAKVPTYRDLTEFLNEAKAHHCRVIFVDLPLRARVTPLDPELLSRLRNAGAHCLDLRRVPGLKATDFADSIHLNPQGRAFFTPRLLRGIEPLLR